MKLRNVKPVVKSNCPESFIFFKNKFNRIQNKNDICKKIAI